MSGLPACDDDDAVRPRPEDGLGGWVLDTGGSPAAGATVYLVQAPQTDPLFAPFVVDSTLSDAAGRFSFPDLTGGDWQVYAGEWNTEGTDFARVSPFSAAYGFDEEVKSAPDLYLIMREVHEDGVVAGDVFYFDGIEYPPADEAEVEVFRFVGGELLPHKGTLANAEGKYAVPGVSTGNFIVYGRKLLELDLLYPFYVTGESAVLFNDGLTLARVPDLVLGATYVDKPAVYIYPREAGPHQVRLALADGVRLTSSIPEYGEGWDVNVAADGRIDGTWDYLFYEVALSGAPEVDPGWCLAWDDLPNGLARIATQFGLNDAERRGKRSSQ